MAKPQLEDIRRVLGDDTTAFCLGIQRHTLELRNERAHGSTLRAIQFLHALMFHHGETVRMVDVLTSFRYAQPDPARPPATVPTPPAPPEPASNPTD